MQESLVFESPYDRIRLLLEHQKYALAEQQVQTRLAENPEDSTLYAYLGLCYLKTSRLTEAHEATNKAISLDPEEYYNYQLLSLIYEREKEFIKGESSIRQA